MSTFKKTVISSKFFSSSHLLLFQSTGITPAANCVYRSFSSPTVSVRRI
jgi:hypothetical protein